MAINDKNGGGHTFDPSKRIRATLGNDFVNSVETEALDRLAEAMATTATKITNSQTNIEETQEMGIREMFGKITHTSPRAEELKRANADKVEAKAQEFDRIDAERAEAAKNATVSESNIETEEISIPKPSKVETLVRATTGIGLKDSKRQNLNMIGKNLIRSAGSFVTTDIMETAFRYNMYDKHELLNVSVAAGVSTAIDFATTVFTTPSMNRVMKIMSDTGIDQYKALPIEEYQQVARIAKKEGVKYAAEHAVSGVILPTAIKYGVSKLVGHDKIESSKILKVATSFGAISTATKFGLTAIRNVAGKKIPENPTSIKQVAKVAANVAINEQIDPTLVGTVIGSVVGYNSVGFSYGNDTVNSTKSKLNQLGKSTKSEVKSVPVVGETVVIPVTTAKSTNSVAKSAASEKSPAKKAAV